MKKTIFQTVPFSCLLLLATASTALATTIIFYKQITGESPGMSSYAISQLGRWNDQGIDCVEDAIEKAEDWCDGVRWIVSTILPGSSCTLRDRPNLFGGDWSGNFFKGYDCTYLVGCDCTIPKDGSIGEPEIEALMSIGDEGVELLLDTDKP